MKGRVFLISLLGLMCLAQGHNTVTRMRLEPEVIKSSTLSISEYLNVQLYELAKKYHHALLKVDISDLMGTNQGIQENLF